MYSDEYENGFGNGYGYKSEIIAKSETRKSTRVEQKKRFQMTNKNDADGLSQEFRQTTTVKSGFEDSEEIEGDDTTPIGEVHANFNETK